MEPRYFSYTLGLLALHELQQGLQIMSGLCKKSYFLAWYILDLASIYHAYGDMNMYRGRLKSPGS